MMNSKTPSCIGGGIGVPQTNITPDMIDATAKQFGDAFGHYEAGLVAWAIVRLCQRRRQGWKSLTIVQLGRVQVGHRPEDLNRGYFELNPLKLITVADGKILLTTELIETCYLFSPAG